MNIIIFVEPNENSYFLDLDQETAKERGYINAPLEGLHLTIYDMGLKGVGNQDEHNIYRRN